MIILDRFEGNYAILADGIMQEVLRPQLQKKERRIQNNRQSLLL